MYSVFINHQHQKGFTLLEVVLVLFILAIITSTSLSFIESEDGQLRYEESLRKRDDIIMSLLRETTEGNQSILSGFIVDNGKLPSIDSIDSAEIRIAHLLSNLDTWVEFGSQTIYIETDSSTSEGVSGDGLFLFKGYRTSNYLIADSSGGYKDGWGEEFYISDINSNSLKIGYDGDGELDFDEDMSADEIQSIQPKPSPFNTDNSIEVTQADWTIDVSQLSIIINNNDNTCTTSAPCDFEVAVVIFRNNSTCANPNEGNCWDTYHFSTGTLNDGESFDTSTDNPIWELNGSTGGSAAGERIPVGEHIALVLDNAGDLDSLVSSKFKVLSRSTQPTVVLDIPEP